jgi:glycine betaine/choline ABC-type transport system substrate-binding protein
MDRTKTVAALTAVLIAALALDACSGGNRAIRVGSKNFTEQVVLGEIIAQHIENRLHVKVDRSLNLGGTLLAHQALLNGQIDLYPEYTGTALAAVLKEPINTNPAAVLARVRSEYAERFQVDWLDPLGIDNGFAMVVRSSIKASTLSDAAKQSPAAGWNLGVGYEFEQRADGLGALKKTYGLRFAGIKTMDLGLLYRALEDGQVGMIAANATDGLLSKMDLKILADDQHAFPPYEVGIEVRQAALSATPGLREALTELSGKFTNAKMQQLNFQVDVRHESVNQVAQDFLRQAGLK